jgi:hypothetical protein
MNISYIAAIFNFVLYVRPALLMFFCGLACHNIADLVQTRLWTVILHIIKVELQVVRPFRAQNQMVQAMVQGPMHTKCIYISVPAAVATRRSKVTPRLVKEKWELKYRIFCLKYFASLSVWLVNNLFNSSGTCGTCTFIFPFLQQNPGDSYWNLITPQYKQLGTFLKHGAYLANFGRHNHKDLHCYSDQHHSH